MTSLLDARGLSVSGADSSSLERYESALTRLHGHRSDTAARIDELLHTAPYLAAAHCLNVAFRLLGSEVPNEPAVAHAVAALEHAARRANERERRHAAAARAWLEGNSRLALERYADLLIDFPRDSLALQLAHALDFRLGQRHMMRDRVAQVLPHWSADLPGFGHVLAMHAFGLEETGHYARAEAEARRALEFERASAAAVHVIAHVFEMQGRAREGIAWLESTRSIWATGGFAVHGAWHLALCHVDRDDGASALAILDQAITPHLGRSTGNLVDAAALLWRLELRGFELQARWRELSQQWKHKPLPGQRAFNLVHAMIAFTAAGDAALAQHVLALLMGDSLTRTVNLPDDVALSVPFCEALEAFGRGDYERAVERISLVRAMAERCGGSVAQCDLIHLTLIEAALRSHRAKLAGALAAERATRKPDSPLNQWLFERAEAVVEG